MKNYKLGLDIGASSIGWSLLEIDKNENSIDIINMGSRIFSDGRDPVSKTPLSVEKRMAHGASVRRDRLLMRKETLFNLLQKSGLMPKDIVDAKRQEVLNPYRLRANAIKTKISLYELGRALFHLNQRRGFKSNRKADKSADKDEKSAMKNSIDKLRNELNGRTLGEYLFERQKNKLGTRMRAQLIKNKNAYEMYADRAMYEDEFNRIWNFQMQFHNELNSDLKEKIHHTIFHQKPLKTPELGFCQFERTEHRAYAAYPISQTFRIWQEVNNLEVDTFSEDELLLQSSDRIKLVEALLSGEKSDRNGILTFANIKKILGLKPYIKFNLESGIRKGLQIDSTAKVFADKKAFGNLWKDLGVEKQNALIDVIIRAENDDKIYTYIKEHFDLSEDSINYIIENSLDIASGTVSLSVKAMQKIFPFLREGAQYYSACGFAGYNFNANYGGELLDTLPYYGKVLHGAVLGAGKSKNEKEEPELFYGKINNPTVHVTLNQLRRVVNAVISRYGKPSKIVVELARDLPLGETGLNDLKKEQKKNQKENEDISEELKKIGIANNAKNRMKYKIWVDLNKDPLKRCCPFCGETISKEKLFTPHFEVEHLLPYSITFDDGRANKVISCRTCNRDKANRTPYEAFGTDKEKWAEITSKVSEYHSSKQKKFAPDALEQFRKDGRDLIARMLNDTKYISKVAREYLSCIVANENVYTVTGRITGLVRRKWGLNSILTENLDNATREIKNREDHRHHAIDAFVIACVGKGLIQKISQCAKICEDAGLDKLITDLPPPFPDFSYDKFKSHVDKIVVSHRPDRGDIANAMRKGKTLGKLHEETAYGPIGKIEGENTITIAKRIKLESLKFSEDNINQIADSKIREDLLKEFSAISKLGLNKKDAENSWLEILKTYGEKKSIYRIRIHLKNRAISTLIPIKDKSGKIYKFMDNAENFCMDIYQASNSKKWEFEVINMYDAHQKNFVRNWRKNDAKAKLVMRLFKSDIIAFEDNNETLLYRVISLWTTGVIVLNPLNKITLSKPVYKTVSPLQKLNARKIYINEIGQIFDPGKPKHKTE